jgi:hypothetical protein
VGQLQGLREVLDFLVVKLKPKKVDLILVLGQM